jgi:hypothetical protein
MVRPGLLANAIVFGAMLFWVEIAPAGAAPVALSVEETFVTTPLVGAPIFLGLGIQAPADTKAKTTISFLSPGTAASACFTLISRDGKYRGIATIKDDRLKVKGSYTLQFESKYPQVFKNTAASDMAVEIKVAPDCNADPTGTRALSWFGEDRPSGPVRLTFQSLGHDSFLVPEQKDLKPIKCEQIVSGINIAFDATCTLPPATNQFRGELKIYDIDGKVTDATPIAFDRK